MNAIVSFKPEVRGFACIGLVRPKNTANIGGVMRAAHVYGVSMVALQGDRTLLRSPQDVTKAWRHIPVIRADDILSAIPYDAVPVAVDLVKNARSLVNYIHPERAFYVFGPEDGTLSNALVERCRDRIAIPTKYCMNLAATVNVVLYDRLAKRRAE